MDNFNRLFKDSLSKVGELTKNVDLNELASKSSVLVKNSTKTIADTAGSVINASVEKTQELASLASDKISEIEITPQDVMVRALNVPGVKIDRSEFLFKELMKYYPEEKVIKAISSNPASMGIPREKINEIADQVIEYETNKVSAISFAAGIPGGFAMAATIPADVAQYFGFLLRIMQKLAYLYGFPEFELSENNISDETMNQLLIFLGVMFGVNGATQGVKIIAETAGNKMSKTLAQKALTKTTLYPIVKKVATTLGFKMTKDVFAKGVSKVVPVVGGAVSGGLTYLTFKPCAIKLKDNFKSLNLSDPEFYNALTLEPKIPENQSQITEE